MPLPAFRTPTVAAILLTAISQFSSAAFFGDYEYFDEGTTISIDGYSNRGKTGALVIPSTINGKPVTSISPYVFEYCTRITSVTIPAGVTTVGSYAFADCSALTSVTLPEGLTTLGKSAFNWCSKLKTIHLPSTLTDADEAFTGSGSDLETVTFAPGTTAIPEGVLDRCDKLTSVTIPSSVKLIGRNAFGYCGNLTNINLPAGLTEIGDDAFQDCPLAKISLPSSLTIIGSGAFRHCPLVRVTFPPSVRQIGSGAFQGCKQLTTAVFTGQAPALGSIAFYTVSPDFVIYLEDGASGIPVPRWGNYRTSKAAPEITVDTLDGKSIQSRKTVNLGNMYVGQKAPSQKAIITNSGIRPLTGLRASISGSGASQFIIKDFKTKSLAPGKSMTVSVAFFPTKPGKQSAKVVIHSNDKNEGSFVIYLSGRGVVKN